MSQESIEELNRKFEFFAKEVLQIEKVNSVSPLIQSLFFHNSIIKVSRRLLTQDTDCGCTPHPGYFVDKVPYWRQEDYLVNLIKVIQVVQDANDDLLLNKGHVLSYLNELVATEGLVTYDKLYAVIESKSSFMERVNEHYEALNGANNKVYKKCYQGSDLGCCGNYSGCCWYFHFLCLYHDASCWNCDGWWCLKGCKPGI